MLGMQEKGVHTGIPLTCNVFACVGGANGVLFFLAPESSHIGPLHEERLAIRTA